MNSLLTIAAAASVTCLLGAPLYFALKNATVGYEDANGFHNGEQSAPVELPTLSLATATASTASVPQMKKATAVKSSQPELTVVAGNV